MKTKILLILILLLAFALRFYQLGQNPLSLSWDEASIGYNAYSIAQTLKDEHGRFLPYDYFSAFGDYKPPVAIYLTAVSVKLFGLTEWAVRMPSALLGVLTVLLVFLLAEELRKIFKSKSLTSYFSLLTSIILAISPWHTLLSRQMFEANIATFFIVFAVYLFIKAINSNKYLFIPSAVLFALSLYTFNSPRVFVPILLLGLVIFFFKDIKKQFKWFLVFSILFLVVLIPLIPHLKSPLGQLRFKEVNIFSNPGVVETANLKMATDNNDFVSKIVHNRRVGYLLLYLNHYFDHFDIDYLFFHGDINPKFSTRATGQMFLIEALFIVLGLYFLFTKEKKLGLFMLFWLLAGLIPASTARETPHALRSEVSLPMWQMISAAGLYYLFTLIKSKWRNLILIIVSVLLIWEIVVYLHNYYVHYPKEYSQDWQIGYKTAANRVQPLMSDYDKIWVSEKYGRPYIFFLLYQKTDPSYFQNNQNTTVDSFGFYHVNGFGKYSFGKLELDKFKNQKTLLIGAPEEIPATSRKIDEINNLRGDKELVIAEM